MKYVEVIGEICLDIIMHYPNSVEVYGQKIWAENVVLTYGGSAAIASAALASLGENVRVYGTVGNDGEGERIIRLLRSSGVECANIQVLDNARTTGSLLQCDGGNKRFLGCSPMLPIRTPPIASLEDTKLIYIAGFVLYPELGNEESFAYYREAARRGIPIVTDGQCFGIEEIDQNLGKITNLMEMISLSDVFLAAKKELLHFRTASGEPAEIAKSLLVSGLRTAVFKRGEAGAALFEDGRSVEVPGYPVEAYDTIGSGDMFGAAYSYGMLRGWSSEYCLQFATVFAAKSLGRYVDTKVFPDKETVRECIKKYYGGCNA